MVLGCILWSSIGETDKEKASQYGLTATVLHGCMGDTPVVTFKFSMPSFVGCTCNAKWQELVTFCGYFSINPYLRENTNFIIQAEC